MSNIRLSGKWFIKMCMESEPPNLTDTDKLIALFAHLSLFFGSLIIPLIFWLVYKEKSKFITFHSMQALIFHICYVVLNVILVIGLAVVIGIAGMYEKQGGKPVTPDLFQIILMVVASIIILGFIAYGLWKSGIKLQ